MYCIALIFHGAKILRITPIWVFADTKISQKFTFPAIFYGISICHTQFNYLNLKFMQICEFYSLLSVSAIRYYWCFHSLMVIAVECLLQVVTCLPCVTASVFDGLFKMCFNIWKEADERERERRIEEESLYHYKLKTCDITGDEEDKEKKEMEAMFPSYERCFSTFENNEVTNNTSITDSNDDYMQFTDNQMQLISNLHCHLYCLNDLTFSHSHLMAYKTAKKLYSKFDNDNMNLSNDWIGAHAKVCYLLMNNDNDTGKKLVSVCLL